MKSNNGPLEVTNTPIIPQGSVTVLNGDDAFYDVTYESAEELCKFIGQLVQAGRESFGGYMIVGLCNIGLARSNQEH